MYIKTYISLIITVHGIKLVKLSFHHSSLVQQGKKGFSTRSPTDTDNSVTLTHSPATA